jgi:drug/metabolite transporter (DMT)-like permease
MPTQRQSLLALHAAVLLFGLAGLFGRWIAAHPVVIVSGRAAVAAAAFLAAWRWLGRAPPLRGGLPLRGGPPLQGRDWALVAACGATLALHWVAFFRAIQVSTLAVALLAYATAPIFAALLEPVFFRERFSMRALAAALVTAGGVALLVPRWQPDDATAQGAAWGVLAGLTFAALSLFNRDLVRRHPPLRLALYQDVAALAVLAPLLPGAWSPLTVRDVALLVALGVVCTAIAHGLFIASLREIPARTAAVVSALEPLYGILFAAALLGEVPGPRTLAGGTLVLGAVLSVSLRRA